MQTVRATEFCRRFGEYQMVAQREPVAVTSHDRTTGVFLSKAEFDHYQELLARERRALSLDDLTAEDLKAIGEAEVPEGFEHLDDLLDEA